MQPDTYNRPYLFLVAAAAALGGLLFGYDWVVIGGAKLFYELFFRLSSPAQQGWAMSCALAGCLLGAALSGLLAGRFGRKPVLMLAGLLFAVSSIGTALANTVTVFVCWRIAGGVAIGLASSLSPMYIAEISPAAYRGKLVALNQLTIVAGVLLAQVMNWLIAQPIPASSTHEQILRSWNGQVGWRWMFAVTALPAALFFFAMFLVPESPRWLVMKGAMRKAEAILTRIGGGEYGVSEMAEIQARAPHGGTTFPWRSLREPRFAKPLLLGIVLAVLQQWCGVNVIFNYAQEVFSGAGVPISGVLLDIILTGSVNLVFTVLAMFLVDRAGRRMLMLSGCLALTLIYILLGCSYRLGAHPKYTLILIVAAIACYAMSLAPVTWVVIAEIFPNQIRGTGVSLAVTALWIASFLLTYTFPLLNGYLKPGGAFWLYAGICAAGFLFVLVRLPETRGQTLEHIETTW